MGRPLNKKYTGNPANAGRTYPALTFSSAWITGAPAIATTPVWIVKQHGTRTYIATDGTYTGPVTLTGAAVTMPGQATMLVTPYFSATESGATFTATYKIATATIGAGNGGSGYTTGNTLSVGNGTVLTVASNAGNAIVTLTVTNAGSRATIFGAAVTTNVPTTTLTGTGTGALVNLTWILNTVTVSGGTGYTNSEALVPIGFTATTLPVVTLQATAGVPTGTFIANAGTNITQSGIFVSAGSIAPTQYAEVVKGHTVACFNDVIYDWQPFAAPTANGQAMLPFSGAGSEQNTYNTAYENILTGGGMPYVNPNTQFVSMKTTELFATAGVPGGSGGNQSQAASNPAQATGPTNFQSTQRKAPKAKIMETKEDVKEDVKPKKNVKTKKDDTAKEEVKDENTAIVNIDHEEHTFKEEPKNE